MEKQTYKTKSGEITFDKEAIVIKDNTKKHYWNFLVIYMCSTFYGVISILRYQKTGDEFLLWSGLVIVILSVVILLIMKCFISTKSEVKRTEIISIVLKQRLNNKFLELKLKGNKIRRVNQIDTIYDELNEYINSYFKR